MQFTSNSIHSTVGATSNRSSSQSEPANGRHSSDGSFELSSNSTFQSLLKFDNVQKFVEREDDGSYSFTWSPRDGVLDTQQQIARNFIEGANGTIKMPEGAETYSQTELDLFKQLTGYNLVQAPSGLETVLDDSGMEPSPADAARIEAAWQLMPALNSANRDGAVEGALSLDELPAVLSRFGVTGIEEGVVESLLKDLMTILGATSSQIENLSKETRIGHEGESIATWDWSGAPLNSSDQADAVDALALIS